MTDWHLLAIFMVVSLVIAIIFWKKTGTVLLSISMSLIAFAVMANTTAAICGRQCF